MLAAEEEARLQAVVEQHTGNDGTISWVGVAADMPGRTDNQVMRHWKNQQEGSRCGGGSIWAINRSFHIRADMTAYVHITNQKYLGLGPQSRNSLADRQHCTMLSPLRPQLIDTVPFCCRASTLGRGRGGKRSAAQAQRKASAKRRGAAGRRKPAKRKRIILSSDDEVEGQHEGGDNAAGTASPGTVSIRQLRCSRRAVEKLCMSDLR
jgi:Myb-like DNA-binding domain